MLAIELGLEEIQGNNRLVGIISKRIAYKVIDQRLQPLLARQEQLLLEKARIFNYSVISKHRVKEKLMHKISQLIKLRVGYIGRLAKDNIKGQGKVNKAQVSSYIPYQVQYQPLSYAVIAPSLICSLILITQQQYLLQAIILKERTLLNNQAPQFLI